jgi:hypothetical protein
MDAPGQKDLKELAALLREQRPHPSHLQLDETKRRVMARRARHAVHGRRSSWTARLVLASVFSLAFVVNAFGVPGKSASDKLSRVVSSATQSGNTVGAASIQYCPKDSVSSNCPPPSEGCTPGYWKQSHHFDSWVGFAPTDKFEAVFGVNVPGNPTLLDALQAGGGGINALERHAVAALLNASSPDVEYLTVSQVIAKVQAAIATNTIEQTKNELENFNQLGCPLN